MFGNQPDRGAVGRMLDRLQHRGPDGSGIHVVDAAALGHRRLTIIDLSDASAQPMVDSDTGCVITYNGEIYNYIELREQLIAAGHRFRTVGDTEVLLKAYAEWGEGALDRLCGMFAFVLVDPVRRRVFGARDHAGQKPLLYAFNRERLIFSSELASLLLHPRAPRQIDRNALCHYFVYDGFVDDLTVVEGVRRLAPGTYFTLQLGTGQLDVRRYSTYRPTPGDPATGDPGPEDFARLEEVMRGAVGRHLRSDVPIGIFLSGGVDSSLITALAADILGGPQIQTFTVRHTERSFDEADDALAVATTLKTQHREMRLTSQIVLEGVPEIIRQLDEPLADPGLVSLYQVARFAAREVKVVLSGDGGDEFFCGYAPFHKWHLATQINALPAWVTRSVLHPMIQHLPAQYGYMGLFYKAQVFSRAFGQPKNLWNQMWVGGYSAAELQRLMVDGGDIPALRASGNRVATVYDPVLRAREAAQGMDDVARLSAEYQSIYLPTSICAHTDKANMMHSLEARSPLLDPAVTSYANALPTHWKLRNGVGKWMLRRYLERRLGPRISRKAKQGFTVPLASWLRGELKPFAERLLAPDAIRAAGLLRADEVQRLWSDHQSGRRNNYKKLWPILVAQVWQERTLGL